MKMRIMRMRNDNCTAAALIMIEFARHITQFGRCSFNAPRYFKHPINQALVTFVNCKEMRLYSIDTLNCKVICSN